MSTIKLGLNIALIRKNIGMSQGELAEKVGITQSYLSQIEAGKKEASISLFEKISKQLKVPVGFIHILSVTKEDIPLENQFTWEILQASIIALVKSIYPEKLNGL